MFGQKRIICGRDHGKNFLHPPNPDYDLPYKFCLKCYKTATDAKVYICNESHGMIEESPENVAITESENRDLKKNVERLETEKNALTSEVAVDAKREEFRKYLEMEDVLEYLTKHLVPLYEKADKPTSALEYLKNNFAGKEVKEAKQKPETQRS